MDADVTESPAVAGLNTNARSFENPSPFTSPATIGVNGLPEAARTPADRYTTSKIGKSFQRSTTV
jgi:hypothetical protein